MRHICPLTHAHFCFPHTDCFPFYQRYKFYNKCYLYFKDCTDLGCEFDLSPIFPIRACKKCFQLEPSAPKDGSGYCLGVIIILLHRTVIIFLESCQRQRALTPVNIFIFESDHSVHLIGGGSQ